MINHSNNLILEALLENSPDACLLIENNRFVKCNQAAIAMLYADSKEEILNTHPSEISPAIQPDGRSSYEKAEEMLAQANAAGSFRFEWLHQRLNGEPFYVDVSLTLLEEGGRNYIYTVWRDLAGLKDSENKLHLMARAINQSGEAIIITGSDNSIIAVNDTFTRLTGYSQEDALGQNPRLLKSGNETKEFYESMWETLLLNNYWQGEIWDRRKDGSLYPKWLTISVVRNDKGAITNYIGSFTDITNQKMAAQRIDHLTHHDPLTNLPNRFSLMGRLTHALEHAKQSSNHLAVMFIDLDRFKNINDSLGHQTGDILLSQVALRLLESVRSTDIVSRLGGDEFVVVLPQIQSGIAAISVADNIRKILSQTYSIEGNDLHITPSIGISVFPHDGATIKELMQNADLAMYDAKARGRNNYQFFKKEMNSVAQEKHLLESDLRSAVDREEFLLHYQPQIDMTTGRVVGVEALIRWQHPFRGLVQPDMFITVAEDTGLILPIGNWVLKTACRQLASWIAAGLPPMRMAVNLSARQFRQDNLPALVADVIAETGIAPHLLELEITESVAMDNPEETILHLRRFKEMGVELAIDDFGTGYSSLSYLKLYPVNRLKIDRSFVKDLETSPDDSAIAAATISLAHALGKKVVAEGVETEGQLKFLREQQCDIVQGYYYSRPQPAAEIAVFLRDNLLGKECGKISR